MMTKKRIQLFVTMGLLFFAALRVSAAEPILNDEVKGFCNRLISGIYKAIVTSDPSRRYYGNCKPEDPLGLNARGISVIRCDSTDLGQNSSVGLTILPLDDPNPFEPKSLNMNYSFPILGLKMVGYLEGGAQSRFSRIVMQNGKELWDYQKRFMPVALSLETLKPKFRKGEDIRLNITLTNVSESNQIVKSLGMDSVTCSFNNIPWKEPKPLPATKEVVLAPKESINKTFISSGLNEPGILEIECSYQMTYLSVHPSDHISVDIIY